MIVGQVDCVLGLGRWIWAFHECAVSPMVRTHTMSNSATCSSDCRQASIIPQHGWIPGRYLMLNAYSSEMMTVLISFSEENGRIVFFSQALEKYSRDLTQAARDGKLDPVIGRDDEIRRTIQILSRRTKNNPILLGEPGACAAHLLQPSLEWQRQAHQVLVFCGTYTSRKIF